MRTIFYSKDPGARRKRTLICLSFLFALSMILASGFGAAQKTGVARPTADQTQSLSDPSSSPEKGPKQAKNIAQPSGRAITDVKTAIEDGKLVVSILSDGPLSHEEFELSKPSRLVLDFPGMENKTTVHQLPINTAKVKQLRLRQFQDAAPKIARMVFDLEEDHGRYEIQGGGQSLRVVFHESSEASKTSPAPANLVASNAPMITEAKSRTELTTESPSPSEGGGASPKEAPAQRAAPPVINDLSTTEIPLSALGTGTRAEVKPRPAAPSVKGTPAPAPPVPTLPTPPHPNTLTIPQTQEASFSGHPLTLDLVDIPLVDFFRLMAEEGGINIVLDPEIKGTTISIKVVKVPWDQIFEAALMNSGLDKKVEGNLVRIARKQTLQEEAKQRAALKKEELLAAELETLIKRLNYAKAASFKDTLTDLKTVRGTVQIDERNNALILTDLPSNVAKMKELVEALDIPQPQVEIEARIVSATRDFARDIGIQWGFVQGNLERVTVGGPNTFGTIGGTRPSQTPASAYIAGDARTGRGASSNTSSTGAGVSTGTGATPGGNFNVNMPSGKPFGGIGISVGNILDTFLLDAAITAGEAKGLAKLISQPKVTCQNNQKASITQGLRFPVQIIANNTITVQFQNAALTLTVTPQITYEGNVVLDLNVENNTADFGKEVNGIPSIRTSESSTRVLVSDGGTTVIGGILTDDESKNENRIPGLANLPLIGKLFSQTSIKRSVQEVLFFVTPRIVK